MRPHRVTRRPPSITSSQRRVRKRRLGVAVTASLWVVLIGLFYYQSADKPDWLSWFGAEHDRLAGTASVIDGDTIEVHGRRIRLFGIDAPESDQMCTASGQRYRCGQRAALALADFIGRQPVSCDQRDTDQYGRAVAICSVAGQDLGAWLVSHGYALAYRRYSQRYVPTEEAAAAARHGLWAGEFQPPWEWRHR
jgi:endonuclease YncB( thermonuclease family)